jgi:glycogen debranching enzyme
VRSQLAPRAAAGRDQDARGNRTGPQVEPLAHHLDDYGVGSIAEIFEGDPPFRPRGCIAQAWSVSETLRAWLETAGERARMPAAPPRTAKAGGVRRRSES